MYFPRLPSSLVLLAFACSPLMVSAQCGNNTSLLSIRIHSNITDVSVGVFTPRSQDNPAFGKEDGPFSFFETDVTGPLDLCVPDDECLTLTITRYEYEGNNFLKPGEDLSATYADQALLLLGPFAYIGDGSSKLVVQFGNCDVPCNDDEALLELTSATSDQASYDYYVVDRATGEQVAQCPGHVYSENRCYWESDNYYHDRICLPKTGCYTLVAGESNLQEYLDRPDLLTVLYGGNQIAQIENLQFAAIDFGADGASCPMTPCAEDEKLAEMFVYRREYYEEEYPNMTWAMTKMVDGFTVEVNGTMSYADRPLVYYRQCLEDDACVRLDLSVPYTDELPRSYYNGTTVVNDTTTYWEDGPYRLVIDGVVYGEEVYRFGAYDCTDESVFSTTTFGGGCSTEKVCSEGESLLDVFLVAGPREEDWGYDVRWTLYTHRDGTDVDFIDYVNRGDVLQNTTYRYLICFEHAEDACTEFGIGAAGVENGSIAGYKIAVDNAVLVDQGSMCESGNCEGLNVIQLGGDCPSDGLSSGSLAGVVVGSASAFGLACLAAYCLFCRKEQGASNEPEQATGTGTGGANKEPKSAGAMDDPEQPDGTEVAAEETEYSL